MTIYGLSLVGFISFHQLYFGTPLPSGEYGFEIRDLVFLFYPHSLKGLSSVYHFLASGALLLVGPVLLSVRHHRHYRPAALYFLLAVAHLVFGPADTWRNSPFLYSALPALSAAAIHGCITSWFRNKGLSLYALGSVFTAIAFQFFGQDARYSVYALAAVSLVVVLIVFLKRDPYRRFALAVSSCICACSLIISSVLQTPIEKRWPILKVRSRTELITGERTLQTSTEKIANSIENRITRDTTAPVLATDRIGRVGYLTGYRIIDLFGRVDATMGNIRRRYKTLKSGSKAYTLFTDYLLRRMPDTILIDEKSGFDHLIAKGITENRDFRRQYTWDSVLDSYTKRKRPLIGQSAIDARLREKPKEKRPEMKPNIVLISIDTLRADHLELYGYFRQTAPRLFELAKNGIFFRRAVSQAPWTLPSMATIMTSLYPFEHRSIIARSRLKDSLKTIAEKLSVHGYYTMGVVSNCFLTRKRGFARGFAMFDENVVKIEDSITSRIITQISSEILATADREPFFLWAHYMDPHYSYHRHPEYRFSSDYSGRFSNRITIMELLDILSKKKANNEIDLTHADFTYLRAVYDEEIAFTDAAIGRLIHFIGSMGYARPTVFLIVADHGDLLGEHNEFGHKEYLYDELIHVPMIIGGAIDSSLRGQKVNAIVENRSVATTIMNLARIRNHTFEGYDLIESARREGHVFEAYSETAGFFTNELETKAAVSFGEWKMIHNFKSMTYELYNIEADKGEQYNLWPNRRSEEISHHLKSRLDGFVTRIKRKQRAPTSEFKLSPSQEKSLRALGYIQ